jgi:CRP-like cAMP-binding protein
VTSPLVKALSGYAMLSHDDEAALARLGRHSVRQVAQRRDLVREGAAAGGVRLILDGWACRYKCLPDGRRQTLAFLIPGDLCDPNHYLLGRMDHGISAITPVRFAEISRAQMEVLAARSTRLADALAWSVLVAAAIQREWILSIGRRNAREQIAHLVVEIFHRLRAIGRAQGRECEFPLTQNDLADATGLTAVHVNRVLKELRRDGLIHVDHRALTIPDLGALERVGLFDPSYLHLADQCRMNGVALQHAASDERKRLENQQMFAFDAVTPG